jgi:hypothetical protein
VTGPFEGWRQGAIDIPILIHDISESGCFVASLIDAQVGRRLKLGISIPGDEPITVDGEVVDSRPGFGFGVRFVDLPRAEHARLVSFVASRGKTAVARDAPEPMPTAAR